MTSDHYRLLFENSSLGIVSTDLQGNFVDANPAFCALLGYTRDELLQLNIGDVTHPEDLPANLQTRRKVVAGEESSEIIEKRYLHKSGTPVWTRLVGAPLRDTTQQVVGLFAMVEDITARKQDQLEMARMQEAIARSEQRLRYITRATLDLVWDWDLVNKELWWSEGLQRLFGFDTAMMGKDERFWLRRAHPDDRPRMIDTFSRMLQGSIDSWTLQMRIRRMDDTYAQVEERAFAIRDSEGRAIRVIGGVSDISERLELEEKLRQSQRLEAVGQLTGGVAHDFNNLLTVILGNAELLDDKLQPLPELREFATAILRSALQGAELTQRLLAFARRQALEPRSVDANRLIDDLARLLQRTLGEDVRLQYCKQEPLWSCSIDPNQLESALLNLALNARDAMPEGGDLMIETSNATLDAEYTSQHQELRPGEYVCIAVSDTGHGIAPEHLGRVLEPFFTTKPKGKGTGLGLSSVFGFVKQSQGHLTLYSEPGHGTTVKLYLPRATAGQAGAAPPAPRPGLLQARANECVLVVEDDEAVRQFACYQLQSLGYAVLSAGTGPEALALVRQHPEISLLFTDVVMPGGMGGRQLAEAACQLRPGLKVLYTSGYTENSIVHHGRLDPGVQLLGKPYQRRALAEKLRAVLDA